MARDPHLAPLARQLAGSIEEKRAAFDTHELSSVQGFFPDHVEQTAHLFVFIRQQLEGKLFLRAELRMALAAVLRDAEHRGAGALEGAVQVAEVLALERAAGR